MRSKLVYSYYDRLIVGGICPAGSLALTVDESVIGASYLLERREMGVINIGANGSVSADGTLYELESRDGPLYWNGLQGGYIFECG